MGKIRILYVTSSLFKAEENRVFCRECTLSDGRSVQDVFEFEIRAVPIHEILEVDLCTMVMAEATSAYSQVKVPCIVEHAGLVFDEYSSTGYPGGLTKPMWNTLGERFLDETRSQDRPAIARAVVAYCDGMSVSTFVGETKGVLASSPRGSRKFYWDTVFIPEDPQRPNASLTYAEIVEDPTLGLLYKMKNLSQSSRAMLQFLEFRLQHEPSLWR